MQFKVTDKIKDIIYIATILVAIGGFLVNEGMNRQKQNDMVDRFNKMEVQMDERLKKIETLMQEQLILNGKIIMYMELDSKK